MAAAVELFRLRGYDAVTVHDITERAGLTRRSFFRHFPDKREVLFADSLSHSSDITEMVTGFAADVSAVDAVMRTLAHVGAFILRDPQAQAVRQQLIDSAPELQERERTKLATVAAALSDGLVSRGVHPEDARVLASVATQMFHAAYLSTIRSSGSTAFIDELERARSTIVRLLVG